MPPDVTPWALVGAFVSALSATIFTGLRWMMSGRIVAGRHYDDALKREAKWQAIAETALQANSENGAQAQQLLAAVRDQHAMQLRMVAMLEELKAQHQRDRS